MKRILSLDGGGIHGLFSLQILARIEQLFREERGDPDLKLADVFDLFAGTSTGAIIATGLAWGKSVAELEQLYVEQGPQMFVRQSLPQRLWRATYRADPIAQIFRSVFSAGGEPALLGDDRLKLVLILLRNASTGSPWPITNNPHAKYNDRSLPDCNLGVPIWKLLRASTAAPTYFAPQEIELGGRELLFVDGGITPFNNPALIAVLTATLPSYKLVWEARRDSLHVTSIGTGTVLAHLPDKIAAKINVKDQLAFVIPALLGSVSVEQDMLCRVLGDCVHGAEIDSELGALNAPTLLEREQQKFTYVRYDRIFKKGVAELSPSEARLDSLELIPWLQDEGRRYADAHVRLAHLYPTRA